MSTHICLGPVEEMPQNVKFYGQGDVSRLCERDIELLKKKFSSSGPVARVAVLPTPALIELGQKRGTSLMHIVNSSRQIRSRVY